MRWPHPRSWRTLEAVALCTLVVACTGDGDPHPRTDASNAPATPSYRTVACPDAIVSLVVGDVECGFLSVPERRDPDRGEVEVFVTRVLPPGGDAPADPLVVVGTNLATAPNYAGISPLSQRTGREVLIVAPRGVGFSRPSLECPEVERSGDRALAAASDDQAVRAAFLAGLGRCHTRLAAAGADVAAYGVAATAADLADLRVALGVERWNLIAYGTASRVAVELLRLDDAHVRAALLDSPELPGMDPGAVLRTRTAEVVREILRRCREDAPCARRYRASPGLLSAAENELRDRPVVLTAEGAGGDDHQVTLDAPRLRSLLRAMVSDGGSAGRIMTPGAVPRVLAAVRDRTTEGIEAELVGVLAALEPHCLGVQPQCAVAHDTAMGALATVICQHGMASQGNGGGSAGRPSAWGLWEPARVCRAWPVGPERVAAMPDVDVPVLVTVGALATHAPPGEVRSLMRPWPAASVLEDAGGGHNVVARTECMIELRNRWLDRPTGDVSAPACLSDKTIDWYL